MRLLAAFALVFTLTVPVRPVLADRATLDKPVAISTVKADKKPLDGRVVSYDDEGFELAQGKGNKTVTVRWDELGAPGQFNVRSALLGPKATGEQWLELGRKLSGVEGGNAFADRAFARAVKLEPRLKADVEAARNAKPLAAVEKPKETGDKGAVPAARGDGNDDDAETKGAPGNMTGPQVVGRVDDR